MCQPGTPLAELNAESEAAKNAGECMKLPLSETPCLELLRLKANPSRGVFDGVSGWLQTGEANLFIWALIIGVPLGLLAFLAMLGCDSKVGFSVHFARKWPGVLGRFTV
jgi:hypothetical protein